MINDQQVGASVLQKRPVKLLALSREAGGTGAHHLTQLARRKGEANPDMKVNAVNPRADAAPAWQDKCANAPPAKRS